MYQPAFTETFLALIFVLLWARWLEDRAPKWVRWIPWAAGAAVIVSQIMAVNVLLRHGDVEGSLLEMGRWIGMGTCLAALALLGVLTVTSLLRGRKA